jgi:CDP-diacylglycerol--glycerol-3-phosphate 3-phosphatidyltransferase
MDERTAAVAFVGVSGALAATQHEGVLSVVFVSAVTVYTAAYTHRRAEGDVGVGDYVTLVRAVLVAYVAGFVATRPEGTEAYLAVSAFLVAAGLDGVDGAVARRFGPTSLGECLDVEVDGLATLVGVAVGVAHGWLPAAYVVVGLARYAFVAGVWLRRVLGMRLSGLSRSLTRNGISALQTGVVVGALAPFVPTEVVRPAAFVAMVPFVVWFLRDWTVVCGRHSYTGERG